MIELGTPKWLKWATHHQQSHYPGPVDLCCNE